MTDAPLLRLARIVAFLLTEHYSRDDSRVTDAWDLVNQLQSTPPATPGRVIKRLGVRAVLRETTGIEPTALEVTRMCEALLIILGLTVEDE